MAKALRLALVSRRYPPEIGGAELVMSYLAEGLARAGADVTVFTAGLNVENDGQSDKATGTPSPHIKRLATSRLRFLGTFLYMRNLRRHLVAENFDLIYVSMLKHDAYVSVDVGKRLGIPVVLRPEGAGETGDLAWQAWGRFGTHIGNRCKTADAFVSISPSIHAELQTAGYDHSKIHDLPNGVPVPEVAWKARDNWQKSPRAFYVGRLAPEKNLTSLIDQWPSVISSFPGASLTLVGEGPERPGLESIVARLGLADSVKIPGASTDPTGLLRHADLFVLPSREEGMSIALLEAMALGIPIVASAIPGNLRLIDNHVHGLLATLETNSGLADAILSQWAEHSRGAIMGQTARERVRSHFSIDTVAGRHLTLFHELIYQYSP